jgi:hypothetical protein
MSKKRAPTLKSARRKNLGLRATPEEQKSLQEIARERGTSIQQLFNEFMRSLLTGQANLDTRFLQALPASAVVKKPDLTIYRVNEGYSKVAGPRESLIGRTIGEIWATEKSAEAIEAEDRTIFKEKHATVRVESVRDLWGRELRRLRFRFPIPGLSGSDVEYLGAIGFEIDEVVSQVPDQIIEALQRLGHLKPPTDSKVP